MTSTSRPLGDRVAKPLRVATLWGLLTLGVGAALALFIGVGAAGVSWVLERFDRAVFGWPTDLLVGIAAVTIPLSIASATWAASYVSTDQMPAGRAVLATALGVAVLTGFAVLERPVGLVAGAGTAFAAAMPFPTWSRLGARVLPVALVTGGLSWVTLERQALVLAGFLALAYPAAALLVWLGDAGWVRLQQQRQ
jgi:hypothetical protein